MSLKFKMEFRKKIMVSGMRCGHEKTVKSDEYEEAIEKLYSLKSNVAFLGMMMKNFDLYYQQNSQMTERFLDEIGIDGEKLDKLNVIHVTGTKGKGSTSAFCEILLRTRGYYTGFFSSPHLVDNRERIRLNGKPLSEEKFTFYFWKVYNMLSTKKECDTDMPAYFKFLTLMAFYVFIQEQVDVAIVEVGIGGQNDCTNVFKNPVVCGITSIGLDHQKFLGSTIQTIAWQKAGIFKPHVPAFSANQPAEVMSILLERAREIGCPLKEVSADPNLLRSINFTSPAQWLNASLALQLVRTWLQRQKNHAPLLMLDDQTISVLNSFKWPGRFQEIHRGSLTYYLDGAHTVESVEVCGEWFHRVSTKEEQMISGPVFKILVFNLLGDRKPELLLQPLLEHDFDLVAFCPNFAHIATLATSLADDVWDLQLEQCFVNSEVWMKLVEEKYKNICHQQRRIGKANDSLRVPIETIIFHSVCNLINWINRNRDPDYIITMLNSEKLANASHVQILVTGSLSLVGQFLSILDPNLTDTNQTCD